MESALSHTAVVEDYIHKELTLSKMAGPFLQVNIQGVKWVDLELFPNNIKEIFGSWL